MWDGDLTSYYQIYCNAAAGGQPYCETILDYGRLIMNCQLSYQLYAFRKDTDAGNMNVEIAYTTDGVNYLVLENQVYSFDGAGTSQVTSLSLLALKKLRFRTSFGVFNSNTTLRLYEVRLMGSG